MIYVQKNKYNHSLLLTGTGKLILRKRLECRLIMKKESDDKNHNNEDVKSYTVCFEYIHKQCLTFSLLFLPTELNIQCSPS
jgi:hypothetical protein